MKKAINPHYLVFYHIPVLGEKTFPATQRAEAIEFATSRGGVVMFYDGKRYTDL